LQDLIVAKMPTLGNNFCDRNHFLCSAKIKKQATTNAVKLFLIAVL
jgi:hypothetical protein